MIYLKASVRNLPEDAEVVCFTLMELSPVDFDTGVLTGEAPTHPTTIIRHYEDRLPQFPDED